MKTIQNYANYKVNGKDILIVSDNYNGSPTFLYSYDILICSKKIISRYRKELIPHTKGKKIIVRYI